MTVKELTVTVIAPEQGKVLARMYPDKLLVSDGEVYLPADISADEFQQFDTAEAAYTYYGVDPNAEEQPIAGEV